MMEKTQIMVVEDELLIAEDIRNKLTDLGYGVSAMAGSREEAIEKVHEKPPDLVLMDIKLGGEMVGVDVAQEITNRFDVPVVYVTGYSDKDTLERVKRTLPFGIVLKPFRTSQLHSSIQIALERHREESRLRKTVRRWALAFNSMTESVILIDQFSVMTFLNTAAKSLTGWDKEAVGKDLMEVVHLIDKDSKQRIDPVIEVLSQGRTVWFSKHLVVARDGSKKSILASVSPIKDEKGKVLDVILVIASTDDRNELSQRNLLGQEELAKWEVERKRKLLNILRHELRAPLNTVLGFSQLLEDELLGKFAGKQRQYASDILAASRRLFHVTESILTFLSLELGLETLSCIQFDAVAALHEAEKKLESQAAAKSIRLSFEMQESTLLITADLARVRDIFYHLLSNAIKFTAKRGEVRVKMDIDTHSSSLHVSVSDTGIGIKSEDQERIFQPFEKVAASLSRSREGLGLGLTLIRRLVQLHGGRIWVKSEGEGKGSTFTIVLPLSPTTSDD